MRQFSATVCAAFALVSLALVAHAQEPAASSTGRASRQSYHVPRTPWGDPDLEGKWPGSSASGIPLQRAESLGTRNTLTDAEFADRLAQAERQKDQDVADFDSITRASPSVRSVAGSRRRSTGSNGPRRSARRR
jgi:hypothetical protein